jgi:hypothetical protein
MFGKHSQVSRRYIAEPARLARGKALDDLSSHSLLFFLFLLSSSFLLVASRLAPQKAADGSGAQQPRRYSPKEASCHNDTRQGKCAQSPRPLAPRRRLAADEIRNTLSRAWDGPYDGAFTQWSQHYQ